MSSTGYHRIFHTLEVMYKPKKFDTSLISHKVLENKVDSDISISKIRLRCPSERGYTLANSLRREILTGTGGIGICALHINNITHEFESIPGVKEFIKDEIIPNLKRLAICYTKIPEEDMVSEDSSILLGDETDDQDKDINDDNLMLGQSNNNDSVIEDTLNTESNKLSNVTFFRISTSQEGDVLGSDIQVPKGYEILNPDQKICTLDRNASLDMYIGVAYGYGFMESHELNFEGRLPQDTMIVDCKFSPINKVSYEVHELTGGSKKQDEIIITIESNNTIDPELIMKNACSRLCELFGTINGDVNGNMRNAVTQPKSTLSTEIMNKYIGVALEEMGGSMIQDQALLRTLMTQNINTLGDLSTKSIDDIAAMNGIGDDKRNRISQILKFYNIQLNVT